MRENGDWIVASIFVFGMLVAPYLFVGWMHYVNRRWPNQKDEGK